MPWLSSKGQRALWGAEAGATRRSLAAARLLMVRAADSALRLDNAQAEVLRVFAARGEESELF